MKNDTRPQEHHIRHPFPPFLLSFQSPLLLKVFVHGALWMRAMAIRFLVPPRPEFLAVRRTPYGSDDGMSFCPAACTTQASGSLDVPDDSMARGGTWVSVDRGSCCLAAMAVII